MQAIMIIYNSVNNSYKQTNSIFIRRMSNNLNYLDQLLKQLLKSKQTHYSQQCISFYIDEQRFVVEDVQRITNRWNETIKCTLIMHRNNKIARNSEVPLNSKCIIYLHGLGSSRLEALSIVQHLPLNYCLCMFDMSGSGKSQGDFTTYGLKESEDIEPIVNYLHKKKYIRQFVLWGRSMGAVATLLYAIHNHKYADNRRSRGVLTTNNSLRNSKVQCQNSKIEQQGLVKAIILDSPFHNFRDIAKQIATQKLSIPNFIVEVALSYVQSSFTRILNGGIGQKYNPFNINFDKQIKLNIPIIFLYSQKDQIVSSYHSQRIIKNTKTKFEKLLINQCNHNESRPAPIINQIFQKLQKFNRIKYYETKKLNESISKDVTINTSCEKKRGIFVYTPSREREYKTIDYQQQNTKENKKRHETIDISCAKYEKLLRPSPKNSQQSLRRSRISLQNSKFSTINQDSYNQDKFFSNIATIDSETNNLITKKLIGIKDSSMKKLRPKRFNMDRRKEVKLTHHKYLQ